MLTPTGVTASEYWDAISNGNRQHMRLTFDNGVVLNDSDIKLKDTSLIDIMNGETDLTFGRAVMKEFSIVFLRSSKMDTVNWNNEFTIEIGVEIDGVTEWVTLGYFKGSRPEKVHYTNDVQFVAHDRMQLFEIPADVFLENLTYPKTFSEILTALCAYVGVEYEAGNELTNIKTRSFNENFINSEGLTCRDLLALMAEACGCYAKITAGGKLKMVWYSEAEHTVEPDDEFALDAFDIRKGKTWGEMAAYTWGEAAQFTWGELGGYKGIFMTNCLSVKQSEDDVGVAYGDPVGNVYTIVDNPFLVITNNTDGDTYIKPIYERLYEFSGYLPMYVECVGNWLIESGDIITVSVEGEYYKLPIFCRSILFNGVTTDHYEATGRMKREEYTTATKQKLTNGGKFHELRNTIDEFYSRIVDELQNYTTLEQTSEALRLFANGVAPAFSSSVTYSVGDIVSYNGKIYKFTTAHPAGTWDATHVTETSISDDAYLRVSGITINADGINISGSKYVRISSGSEFEVSSQNFELSSEDGYMRSGRWKFNDNGITLLNDDDTDRFVITNTTSGFAGLTTPGIYFRRTDLNNIDTYRIGLLSSLIDNSDRLHKAYLELSLTYQPTTETQDYDFLTVDCIINTSMPSGISSKSLNFRGSATLPITRIETDSIAPPRHLDEPIIPETPDQAHFLRVHTSPTSIGTTTGITYPYNTTVWFDNEIIDNTLYTRLRGGSGLPFKVRASIVESDNIVTSIVKSNNFVTSDGNMYFYPRGTSGGGIVFQEYTYNNVTYTKIYGTNSKLLFEGEIANKTTSATSFDAITETGSYWIALYSMTDAPSGLTSGYGYLEVNYNADTFIYQRLWIKNQCYVRSKLLSSTWSSWYMVNMYKVS